MKPYRPKSIKVTLPFNPPKQQHNFYVNGNLVASNQWGEDKIIKLPVKYVVKSDYWWAGQHVTNKQGIVWETDVFQYGDAYVILMTNGDKMQVVHDGDINWHII